MIQIGRNITVDEWGFLQGQHHLIHDGDKKFSEAFRAILPPMGVEPIKLPPISPNLNAFAERWVRTVKSECIPRLVFFGEDSLRKALANSSIIIEKNEIIRARTTFFFSRRLKPCCRHGMVPLNVGSDSEAC